MQVDTIAVTHQLQQPLDVGLFDAGVTRENKIGQRTARYWLNADGVRITYYPAADLLKVQYECSVVPSSRAAEIVTESLRVDLDVWHARVNRIDYCHDFAVSDADVYLDALKRLRVAAAVSHPFPQGIVWKLRSRWIKFYVRDDGTLRYEVSNYKRAVARMCQQWFSCERTLAELLHTGRTAYVLARSWDRLGLVHAKLLGSGELLAALRQQYTTGASSALYVLMCIEAHGSNAVSKGLLSRSMYYDWKQKLTDDGYLARIDARALRALSLPVYENLKIHMAAGDNPPPKNLREIFGINDRARLPDWLLVGE